MPSAWFASSGRWAVAVVLVFGPALAKAENCVCAPCDFDQDGDVDLTDFAHLQLCFSGFAQPQLDPSCRDTLLDADSDVDAADLQIFRNCLTGTNVPVSGTSLPPVVISEFMASNASTLADDDGENSDWIELYVPCAPKVELGGWHLTDDPADPTKWRFPEGVVIPRGSFLIVFASGKDRRDPTRPLHTNFNVNKDGEYLAVTAPDGTVVHSYAPQFPEQVRDVSYGLAQFNTAPVSVLLPARFHVPTAGDAVLETQWTELDFDDSAWSAGPTGLGFSGSDAQFNVTVYRSAAAVDNLAAAEAVLADTGRQIGSTSAKFPVLNLANPEPAGRFSGDVPFPGTAFGTDQDDFVVLVTATVNIPSAGEWTFGVHSDEGFRLTLTRGATAFTFNYPEPRGGSDTLATFNVTQPGSYQLRLVSFERGGDASLELFAAPGERLEFDPAVFRLVGDAGGGGLATGGLAGEIGTDVGPIMKGVNASLWVRILFQIDHPADYNSVTFRMKYEDGYVAYLNGREVARKNAPAVTAWNSAATANRSLGSAENYESIDLSGVIPLLRPGANVLAIHGLNDSAADADFLVRPELVLAGNRLAPRYFSPPTPGALNGAGVAGLVGEVAFSVPRGFYTSSFQLALSTPTPGAEIRYTLNGATPTAATGSVYTSPLTIGQTSTVRAAAFKPDHLPGPVMTHTYLFLHDVILQSPQGQAPGPGWPTGTVNGQVFDYGMDPDVVNHPLYKDQMVAALASIPSLSFVTDLPNLFDPATGIFTHATENGMAWERPASVELLNPDGSPGFQINAGLRIRGGVYTTPGDNPKHAYRLFFRARYGEGKLRFPLFGPQGADEFDKIDIKTANDFSWSWRANGAEKCLMIRDVFSRDCQRDMGQPHTRGRFYHLYLNGQYWGLFDSQERVGGEFGASYLGGDPDGYDTIKVDSAEIAIKATEGDTDAYYALWQLAKSGFSGNANYYKAQGLNPDGTRNPAYAVLLDVDNCIDDNLITYFTGDSDGPISGSGRANNFYALRLRGGERGFAFFQHDSELSLLDPAINRTGPYNVGSTFDQFNEQWLHQQLCANAEYRMRFADRAYRHFYNGGALTPEAVAARFNARAAEIDLAIIAESARWGDAHVATPYTKAHWLAQRDWTLNTFFPGRRETVIAQFKAKGWYPQTGAPVFSQHGGAVQTGYPLTMSKPSGTSGTIYYTLDGSDPRLPGGGVSPTAAVFADGSITFIARGSTWKYYDAGGLAGTSWRTTGYTGDAAWPEGPAELGYGDGDEARVIGYGPNANNKYITAYFRRKFTVAPGTVCTGLWLGLLRDDGAAVYLNGSLVVRDNLPSSYTSTTPATNCVEDDNTFWSTSLDPARLNEGTNVVAVEVHQCAPDSTDLSFDLELIGTTAAQPVIISQNTRVKARVLNGSEWSPLAEAVFLTEPVTIRINEFMAENSAVLEDPDEAGEFPDWIELYNPGTVDVDLGGMYLTDDPAAPTRFRIPNGVVIPRGGYLVFLADEDRSQGDLHTNFRLSKSGETIALYAADGVTLHDLVTFGGQTENVSEGRFPDGAGPWGRCTTPTPGAANAPHGP